MHAHLYIIASILLHATGESGYSCKYLKGFEGNLYLQYGCKGIFSYIFICDFLDHENLVLRVIMGLKSKMVPIPRVPFIFHDFEFSIIINET